MQPEPAAELGDLRAAAVLETGADVVAAGNVGCLIQLAAALERTGARPLPVARHTVELLDASLRGTHLR
jgi:glycolate oxidase iron-sulfur subunit